MDRRLTASNGDVADIALQGQVAAKRLVSGHLRQIGCGVADLFGDPQCQRRERQLLQGDHFNLLDTVDGVAFGQSAKDGYVGYLNAADLIEPVSSTHIVSARATHLYAAPDIKTLEHSGLSFGSRLRIVGGANEFFETHTGLFVPRPHVRPANAPFTDPASIAQLFFGTPYLWGGNSSFGIDCSGLVQASLLACGLDCPPDSDMQEAQLGVALTPVQETRRGDLFFWRGHVAMAVDGDTLIHANAHSMSVSYEPIDVAVDRIAKADGGPVTSRRRV